MLSFQPGVRGINDLPVGLKMATFQLFSVQGTGGSRKGPPTVDLRTSDLSALHRSN
jgi:hypothetical protein